MWPAGARLIFSVSLFSHLLNGYIMVPPHRNSVRSNELEHVMCLEQYLTQSNCYLFSIEVKVLLLLYMLLALVNYKYLTANDQPRLGFLPHFILSISRPLFLFLKVGLSFWLITCTFSTYRSWEREDAGSVNLCSEQESCGCRSLWSSV